MHMHWTQASSLVLSRAADEELRNTLQVIAEKSLDLENFRVRLCIEERELVSMQVITIIIVDIHMYTYSCLHHELVCIMSWSWWWSR